MKLTHVSMAALIVVPLVVFLTLAYSHPPARSVENTGSGRRVVIVELFTSEGCSSCPPADTLLKKLSEQPSFPDTEIIAMEEHVDYWDHLGWKDPFSSSEFTERQNEYARTLGNGGVYTPQMIVDGNVELVGSRSKEALEVIQKAASQPRAEIQIVPAAAPTADKAAYEIKITNLGALSQAGDAEFWIAVTEKGLHNDVTAGENSGERLQHAAIVRSIQKVDSIRGSDDHVTHAIIKLHNSWQRENLAVVAFAVEKKSHRIIGANSAPIAARQ
jgi:hypothetical protein